MSFTLSLDEIKDPNTVGEVLRDWSFKEMYGCYSCFDLIFGFKDVKINEMYISKPLSIFAPVFYQQTDPEEAVEYRREVKSKMSLYYNEERDILVAWYWEGDGELYFNAGGIEVYNKDCKKDYTWEFVEEML